MDSVLAIVGELETSMRGANNAIDKVKSRYDELRNARSEYLKIEKRKHLPFSIFHKRKLSLGKEKYSHIFDEIFDDFLYFTKKIYFYLSKLLNASSGDLKELEGYYDKLNELLEKFEKVSENINIEYLSKSGIEDFDYELLYARNLISDLNGTVARFKQKYGNGTIRARYPKKENSQPSEEKQKTLPTNE